MAARAEPGRSEEQLERAWWLRVPAVLLAPTAVFAALRDDSTEAARARQEPISLVVGCAGIAYALDTPVSRHLLNDPASSTIVIPVWAFVAGALSGLFLYWLLGALLYGGVRAFGSLGSYRRARHVLALASTPLALSLVALWPIRIALYGTDLFRTGGDDFGRGDAIFGGFVAGFGAWSLLLLVIGVRAVHGWTWWRATAAVSLAAVIPALAAVASTL
jgi:hypothetical protein